MNIIKFASKWIHPLIKNLVLICMYQIHEVGMYMFLNIGVQVTNPLHRARIVP